MPLSIFVAHPSSLLTDHAPHGDGLLAHRFILELAQRGHRLHVAAERVDLRECLPSNVRVYSLAGREYGRPGARLVYMWRLRRLFRRLAGRESFQIIHQLNPVHAGLTLAVADAQVPIVLGPYVPDWPDRRTERSGVSGLLVDAADRLRDRVSGLQQRRAAAILLSSPAAQTKVRIAVSADRPVHDLPYGIDDALWIPDPGRDPQQDVLFVGRLRDHKGIFVLMEAFETLAASMPAARLRFAGAGPAADELAAQVRASPARSQIELLGNLDRAATVQAVRACDVYCLPSYEEPFGLGVLEAMSCGKAVVVTDAGGPRHLVDDEGGRRVPPRDAGALAEALGELLADAGLRSSMGAHNRHVVEARYAWPRVLDRLEGIYQETLLNAPRQP